MAVRTVGVKAALMAACWVGRMAVHSVAAMAVQLASTRAGLSVNLAVAYRVQPMVVRTVGLKAALTAA